MAKKSKVIAFGARKNKKRDSLIALQKRFNQLIPTNQVIAYVQESGDKHKVKIDFLRNKMTYEAELPNLDVTDDMIKNILMWAVADIQERMIEKYPDVS